LGLYSCFTVGVFMVLLNVCLIIQHWDGGITRRVEQYSPLESQLQWKKRNGSTIRSSIADARVVPTETKSKPKETEDYKMLRPGFEPGISDSKGVASPDTRLQTPAVASPASSLLTTSMNWDKYKEYLYVNLRPNTARLALKYGKKYYHILQRMDVKDLLALQPAKQRHIMKALANLAMYNGVYEQWNNLRRQHKLKWSMVIIIAGSAAQSFRLCCSISDADMCIFPSIPLSFSNMQTTDSMARSTNNTTTSSGQLASFDTICEKLFFHLHIGRGSSCYYYYAAWLALLL
jgi:hypothetical protein